MPFFEKYKSVADPWPWKSDPKGFWTLVYSSIPKLLVNHFGVFPLAISVSLLMPDDPFVTEIERYPSVIRGFLQILFLTVV